MVLAAIPEIARNVKTWTLSDLAYKPILTFPSNTRPYRQIKQMLAPFSVGDTKITSSASLGAIVRLALSGFGICALPKTIIAAEIESNALEILPTDFDLQPIFFTASYVSGSATSNLASEIASSAAGFLKSRLIKKIYQN